MRILHVTSSLAAGTATTISWLTRMQTEAGHEVHLCHSAEIDCSHRLANGWKYNGSYLSHLHGHYPWMVRRQPLSGNLLALKQLLFLIRVLEPDIMHLHCTKAGLIGRIAGSALKVPMIYQPHGASFYRRSSQFLRVIYSTVERVMSYVPATVVACSYSEGEQLSLAGIRCSVIPNAVDFDIIDAMLRENAPAPRTDKRFTVAVLGMAKFQRMPDVVATVAKMSPAHWHWRWIGGGAAKDLDLLKSRFEVTGWLPRERAITELLAADVVLHASRWEGMPNALLEAMAIGKAVVVSDVVGTRDVIDHGRDGILVRDVESPEAYLSALRHLEMDTTLRSALGRSASIRVRRDHDCRVVAQQWRELYERLIARPRSAGPRVSVAT